MNKEEIQTLMLNSIDYFQTANGEFEYSSTSGNFNLLVTYQTDLSDNSKSYEKVQTINPDDSLENGYVEKAYDGEYLYNYNSGSEDFEKNSVTKDKKPKKVKVKVKKVSKEERKELKGAKIDKRIVDVEGEKAYIRRIDPSYMALAKTSLFPEDLAMGFLEDNSQWDIEGQEIIAGKDTIVIKGKLNSNYSKRYNSKTFKLNIDPNTGIMLQMEVYDKSGSVTESLRTRNIEINQSLDNGIFTSIDAK
ncbi:sigma-E factor regulatory protein RseB domain-containing protein [Bacillus sp. SCS-151]|uniref:sigma-E factor regulatory protein RseB domain-containing protein n=1 Tax=Nanhaiella sioensis TaxID=3115293 RepID=UPI00397E7661